MKYGFTLIASGACGVEWMLKIKIDGLVGSMASILPSMLLSVHVMVRFSMWQWCSGCVAESVGSVECEHS